MKSPEHKLAEPTNTISNTIARHDCVLLIAADADEAAKVLGELGSVTEERFQVEWVTELSRGIERLREGGVAAAVLDLNMLDLNMFDLYRVDRNLPGSQNAEILDQLFQAAPSVPILILSAAETEAAAREGVQRGAQDYLLKEQADGYRLRRAVRAMMECHTAEAVALENEVANATLDSIGEAVLRTDIRGSLTYLNRVAEKMTGWFREEALGRPIEDVLRLVDSVSGAAVDNAVATVIHGDRTIAAMMSSISCTLVRRDGVELGIENRVTVVNDRASNIIGAVLVIRDVGAARAASLETSRASQHDVLTNLPNRTLFKIA